MQKEQSSRDLVQKSASSAALLTASQHLWDILRRSGELIIALRDDNSQLTGAIVRLETENELRRQNYDELAVQFARLQERNRELDDRVAGIVRREELQEEIDRSINEKDAFLSELNAEVANLKRKISEITEESKRSEELLKQRDIQLERLENSERENKTLRVQLNEIEQFRMNMEIMQKELARRNAELNSRLNEVQKYRNRVAELENNLFRIPKLESELADAVARAAEQGEEIRQMQKIHHQASEYSRLHEIQQATLEAYSQKNLEYNVQLTARAKELEESASHIKELEKKLSEERVVSEKLHIELRTAREYEAQISQHLASLEQYASQVVEAKKINHQLEDQIKEMTELLSHSEVALKSEVKEKIDARELSQLLSAKYEAACADLEKKEATNAEMEEKIVVLRAEAQQSSEKCAELQKKLTAIQNELKFSYSEKSKSDDLIKLRNEDIGRLNEEIALLNDTIAELRGELRKLIEDRSAADRVLNEAASKKDEEIEKANAIIENKNQELSNALAEYERIVLASAKAAEDSAASNSALLETITKKDAEINRLLGQFNLSTTEKEHLTDEITSLKNEFVNRENVLLGDIAALNKTLEDKNNEVKQISQELSEAWKSVDSQRDHRENEREAHEGEKQSFIAEIREKEGEIKRIMERIALLESDYAREKDNSTRRIAALNSQLDEASNIIAEKDLRIESLAVGSESMRDELERDFIERRANEAHLREKVEKLQLAINKSDEHFERALKDNADLRKEADDVRIQSAELSAQLDKEQRASQNAIKIAEEKYAAILAENQKLNDIVVVLREAQQDSTRINERNDELESEVNSLTLELSKTRQALHHANQKDEERKIPSENSATAEDQKDKVLGKIGDVIARLEGALRAEN